MVTKGSWYTDPQSTMIQQDHRPHTITATGVQGPLRFRSKLSAVVTGIHVQVNSAATGSLILTLLVGGSVAAILTLGNTADENGPHTFTLTANRTLADITELVEISTPTHAAGEIDVVYEYYIVPNTDVTTFGAIS
jgi:hypothetical protein